MDENISPVVLPKDLGAYLREGEARFDDIRPGTEKSIVWADQKNPAMAEWSVVYLHGFSASRQEVAPLVNVIAQDLGANVFYTRFTGHGRDPDAMGTISTEALLHDALEALAIGKRLGNKVVLMGSSTGATLATWLASRDQAGAITALVLMSPNFGLHRFESELLLYPGGKMLLKIIEGPWHRFEPHNVLHRRYWTTHYPSKALIPLMEVVKLTRNKNLSRVQHPLLMLYSPRDEVINAQLIPKYFARFGSPRKALHIVADVTDPQHHTLAGDILSPESTPGVAKRILEFIAENTAKD